MIRILLLTSALTLTTPALAQDHGDHAEHHHDDHDHHGHGEADESEAVATDVTLSRTADIQAALDAGGQPVVIEVLGVVCDFCAKAMNKTFGKREEVSAVYVDLDTKTLNLVLSTGATMPDDEINRLVVRAGYKAKAIHRGDQLLRGPDASDPA